MFKIFYNLKIFLVNFIYNDVLCLKLVYFTVQDNKYCLTKD